MEAVGVVLGHDVEEEGVSVVVEGLVIQEQFGQQAEVLGIRLWERGGVCVCARVWGEGREKVDQWCYSYKTHFVFPSVDLEKGDVVLPIDLVPGRVMDGALGLMSLQTFQTLQVLEAELADVDHWLRGQFLGVR